MEKYIREGGDFMREIKFRIYGKENQIMYSWEEILDFDSLKDSLKQGSMEDKYYSPLMQYTGVKDMNGKEIYEYDIVTYIERNLENAFGADEEPWLKKTRVIKWVENVPKGFVKEIQVIGNMYENPELMDKK